MSSLGVVDMEVLSPKALHDEMQAIVKEQEEYVRKQLEACRDQIQQAACILLEQEKISGDTFRNIVGPLTPVTMCSTA